MCFFIAGIHPRTKVLSDAPRRCPRCGLYQAYQQQVDHYLSLFFVPLIKVRTGEPFLYCRRCKLPVTAETPPAAALSNALNERTCDHCGRVLKEAFRYCPYCGQRR